MSETAPKIACLLLAAGQGSRMGTQLANSKLLLPWQGTPIICHVLATALRVTALSSITVVLGHKADEVRQALLAGQACGASARIQPDFVRNELWQQGQSTSLVKGIQALMCMREQPGIAIVMLGDQPLLQAKTIELLLDRHQKTCAINKHHAVTVPVHKGQRGNPAVLSARIFPKLLGLTGDAGARSIFETLGENLVKVAVDDAGVVFDVDTPEGYNTLLGTVLKAVD